MKRSRERGPKTLRVLFVLMEFPYWRQARPWAYTASCGLLEGLAANGVETFILPAFGGFHSHSACTWLSRAAELCRGMRFDQAWMWLRYVGYDDPFVAWVSEVAEARVGWLNESLHYDAQEIADDPGLASHRDTVMRQMGALTHLVTVDERDAEDFNAQGIKRAAWGPVCVPQRFVATDFTPPAHADAAFYGAQYGKRQALLQHPDIRELLALPQPPEEGPGYPGRFDELHGVTLSNLQGGVAADGQALSQYVDALRAIRQDVFSLWMESLKQWSAIVNLPAYVKTYSGRVMEAMAAGRPVISWVVPDRPRTRALFEDGREILLFDGNDPDRLAGHIHAIQREPDLGRRIAENAREKVLRHHTAEIRVRQILDWVQAGAEPDYGA